MEIIKISVTLKNGKKKTFKYRVSDVALFEVAYERVLENFDFTRSEYHWDKEWGAMAFLKSSGYLEHYKRDTYREFDLLNLDPEEYIDMILYLIKKFSSRNLVIERYKQPKYYFGGKGLFL